MRARKRAGRGTVAVGVVILTVLVVIILSIIRHFWFSSANEHYDKLIKAYIIQKSEYSEEDADKLRRQLLGDSPFMRMHIWDKDKLIVVILPDSGERYLSE